MIDHYTLDANNCPRLAADLHEYYRWKNSLPAETQTGIGVQLAKTVRGGVCVSTVYLGSDHSYDDGPPVLWETMIFGGEHDEACMRYRSHREAMRGHQYACKLYLPVAEVRE